MIPKQTCQYCGAPLSPNATSCDACGQPIPSNEEPLLDVPASYIDIEKPIEAQEPQAQALPPSDPQDLITTNQTESYPDTPKPPRQKSRLLPAVLIIAIIVIFICCCIMVSLIFLFNNIPNTFSI
jgi:hypothetical protein